ncbi:MAG: formate--tetrahydrofolate ligase [Bacilli bacterium]|nr:formate--tetrahydrofolate ligase [Bacilli bacterium]
MSLLPIQNIAAKAGIDERFVEPYGKFKAKIDLSLVDELKDQPDGKLVLVTAITPTKAGEGKTTTSVALADGFAKINQKAMLCLREPSLGPVFGLKGGATGGGKVTVEPQEDINLHFTGDMHALTSSINLIAAVLDNSIYQGNPLGIDPEKVAWKRSLDMNDRALRHITISEGDPKATPRKDEFQITVASELMAILCLARSPEDFLARLEKIIVAYTYDDKPITVKDLQVTHAVMRLMKDAFKPNLVQTAENNPAFIHGGPFANIAHGCSSIIATKLALKLAPIVVTEAGFGADLGAEKFLDIKCQEAGVKPAAVVVVATIRALKLHGGISYEDLKKENVEALSKGICNLEAHIESVQKYGLPYVVAINHFADDSEAEVAWLRAWCEKNHHRVAFLDGFEKGGEGAVELAKEVLDVLAKEPSNYHPLVTKEMPLKEKISTICREIYGADGVEYTEAAEAQLRRYEELGFEHAYICMAKTPASLSDDATVVGRPKGFKINVREVRLSAGANFVVPLTGSILTMPGLPKIPAAVKMESLPWK